MLIAVPYWQGRVSPVFDVAARLLVVRLKGQAEVERKNFVLFEKELQGIVRSLRELGADILICGGISRELQTALELAGIEVVAHICGEVEPVLAAYRARKLHSPEFLMPGCCTQAWEGRSGTHLQCRRRRRSRRPTPTKSL